MQVALKYRKKSYFMGQVIFLTPSCPLGHLKIQNFFLFFFFRPLNSISPKFPRNGDLFRHFPSFLDLFWNLKKNFFWKIFLGFFSKIFFSSKIPLFLQNFNFWSNRTLWFISKNSIFLAKFQFFACCSYFFAKTAFFFLPSCQTNDKLVNFFFSNFARLHLSTVAKSW